jgi:hypothetical protein
LTTSLSATLYLLDSDLDFFCLSTTILSPTLLDDSTL